MYKQDGRARGTLRLWLSVLLIAAQALLSPLAVLAEDMPPPTLEMAVEPSNTNPAGDVSLTPDVPVLEGDPVESIVPEPLPDIAGPDQIPTLDEADPSDIPGVGEGWDVPRLVQAPGRTDMTPMDVRDVLALAGVSRTSIIDGLSVAFMEGGNSVNTPDENAEIALTLHMLVPQGVPSMLAQDDWYTVTVPGTLVLDEGQAFDLAHEGVPYARLDTRDNEIRIHFQDAARTMDFIDERFTVQAVFAPGEYASGQEIVLSLPDEDAPDVSFTMAQAEDLDLELLDDILEGNDEAWTRTDDTPMDVKAILAALGLPTSILTDFGMTFTEPDGGQTTSTSEATIDAAIDFLMKFHIPPEVTANMREGDTYTITLPAEVTVGDGQSYELRETEGGPSYATASVQGNKIVLTFHAPIETLGDTYGNFSFSGSFNKDQINTPGGHEVTLPDEPDDLSVTVDIISKVEQQVDKKGTIDKSYNPSEITWDVDFNKGLAALTGATLTDAIPAGLVLEDVEVFTIGVDLDGNVIPNSESTLDSGAYSVDADGTVHFGGTISDAIRVRYHTRIDTDTTAGGDIPFTNNATLSAQDMTPLTATATVTAHYGRFLEKRNTGYDPIKQEFTWEIRYNYGQQSISAEDATLTDVLSGEGMIFEPDTVVIKHVSIDGSGNPSVGAELSGDEYTISVDGDTMLIHFPQGLDEAVIITYKTRIDGIVTDSGIRYSNDVSTTWGEHDHATGAYKPTVQQNIIKAVYSANEVNRQITWTIDVNKSGYMMYNWRMTDTLGQGLTLTTTDMVAIVDLTARTTLQGDDYTIEAADDMTSFTITFTGEYAQGTDHHFQIVYYTKYDDTAPSTITNQATGTWEDEGGTTHSSTGTGSYPRTQLDVDGGEKYGTYNAVTKEITWAVLVNYHEMDYRPATLVDPIKGNQQYIHDSIRFYQYIAGADYTVGAVIDPGDAGISVAVPDAGNNQTLTVSFPNDGGHGLAAFWVVFKTSLVDQIIGDSATYDNDAIFTANGKDYPLHGEVSINNGGKLLNKTGSQSSDGYVHWTAVINPSQSTLASPVLTDTPSDNQRIDMDSLGIYPTTVDEAGNITGNFDQPLQSGTDYTASYADSGNGTWVLTVRFAGTIDTAYILRYRASVYLTEHFGKVSNNIHLEGQNGGDSHEETDNPALDVEVHEGGGTIYGSKGALTLRKTGADDQPLPGAVLVLVDAGGNRFGPVTVGEDGLVSFKNLVQGTYTLYEMYAPDGYSVSRPLANGMSVTVDDGTTAGNIITITNEQTLATFKKVDLGGMPLAGAVFHLEMLDTATGLYVTIGEPFTTGADGVITVRGLLPGTYRFIEDSVPEGYILNTDPITFTLVADAKGIIAARNMGNFVNAQGRVRLTKVDEDGTGLAGAEFTLEDASGVEVGTYTSDGDGVVTIDGLAPGTYTLRETRAPQGYTLVSDPRSITIPEAAAGVLPTLNLGNMVNRRPEGSVQLRKVDGVTGEGLAGAEFVLTRRDDTQELARVTTGADGLARIDGLAPGEYRLTEVTAPTGYIRNTTPWDFTIEIGDDGAIAPVLDIGTYGNYQGAVRLVKANEAQEGLQGAEFTLEDASGTVLGKYYSDNEGVVTIDGLAPGTYTLRETRAPRGYALVSDPRSITIPDANAGELPPLSLGTMINHPPEEGIQLRKEDGDTGEGLAGAEFILTLRNASKELARVITDANGYAHIDSLVPGEYRLIEVTPPEGYILNTEPWYFTVTVGADGSVAPVQDIGVYYNYRGKVSLTKVDGDANGLAGAQFTLENAYGDTVGTYTSGEDGLVTIDGLAPGIYTLRETRAPQGYILVSDPRSITIPDTLEGALPPLNLGAMVNPRPEEGILLRKVDGDTGEGLAGAEFVLTYRDGAEELARVTTDANGYAHIDSLAPGEYRLTEVVAPEGYILNTQPWDFTVTLGDDGSIAPVQDIGEYANYRGKARLNKVDADGNGLAGAVFTLEDANGNTVGTYTSGNDGTVTIDGIAPGTYTLRETHAPIGFTLASDPHTITIPDQVAGELPALNLGTMTNFPLEEGIILRKVDGDTNTGLAGAEFILMDKTRGTEVMHIITDANGQAQVEGLAPGDYELLEVAAPDGYIRNTQPWDFTVEADADGGIAPVIDIGGFENSQGKVQLAKVDEHGNPLPGATFTLWRADGTKLGDYVTDQNGVIELYQLAPGEYRIGEVISPHGYALSGDPMVFTIPEAVDGILPMLHLGPVVNERAMGVALVHKVDAQTGVSLAGATFALIDEDTGAEITRVTTDGTGYASVSDLTSGDYAFVEVSAPYGYAVDHTPLEFTITDETQAAAVEVTSRDVRLANPPATPRPTLPPNGPPQTGDTGNGPWTMVMLASGLVLLAALGALLYLRRRSSNH